MDANLASRFIKGVSATTIGTFAQLLTGLLSTFVAVRFTSKEDFGVFVIIQVVVSFLAMITSLLLNDIAPARYIAGSPAQDKVLIARVALSFRLAFAMPVAVILLFIRPVLTYLFKQPLDWTTLVYIGLLFVLTALNSLLGKVMQGYQLFRPIAQVQLLNGLAKVGLTYIFLVRHHLGLLGLIWATLIPLMIAIIQQCAALKFQPLRLTYNYGEYKKLFTFGFPLGINNILSFVFTRTDRFIIASFLNPVSVAYYDVALRIPDSVRSMFDAYQSVYFPSVAELAGKQDLSTSSALLNNSLRIISFAAFFATLVATIYRRQLTILLFSRAYLASAPALPLSMLAMSIGLIGNLLGTTLVALGHSDKPAKINVVDAAANVGCNFLLIPSLGFIGAAYAAIIARSVTNPINVYYLRKSKVSVDISVYLKPLAAYIVCCILCFLLRPAGLVAQSFLLITYIVFNLMTSVISRRDAVDLAAILRPVRE